MNNVLTIFFLVILALSTDAQNLKDINYGSSETMEIVTWNLHWFPSNSQHSPDSIATIIKALDADIIAVQEIDNPDAFDNMMAKIDGFSSFYDPDYFGGLGYIYKTNTIEFLDSYEIYSTFAYWNAFPRAPLVFECRFGGKKFVLINNHLKCCGDGQIQTNNDDEEYRRLIANDLLKQYMDTNHPFSRVILLGDLNDVLTDSEANNVFQAFIDDNSHYDFVDMTIAMGGSSGWSYPSWPSHLDHILISNELFQAYAEPKSETRTIRIDDFLFGGFDAYEEFISDHRPVGLKLDAAIISATERQSFSDYSMDVFPNPASDILHLKLPLTNQPSSLIILNQYGAIIRQIEVSPSDTELLINTHDLLSGYYFVQWQLNESLATITRKLVIIH